MTIQCAITRAQFQTYHGLYMHHERIREWLKNKGLLTELIEDLVKEDKKTK